MCISGCDRWSIDDKRELSMFPTVVGCDFTFTLVIVLGFQISNNQIHCITDTYKSKRSWASWLIRKGTL